jgi:phosphatidylethanolamine N-methyltransferase
MWMPVHSEEWDGDFPLGLDRPPTPVEELDNDVVVFKGDTLPWSVGRYEVSGPVFDNFFGSNSIFLQVRYHHDGKYNVMSIDGPFEIYGRYLLSEYECLG